LVSDFYVCDPETKKLSKDCMDEWMDFCLCVCVCLFDPETTKLREDQGRIFMFSYKGGVMIGLGSLGFGNQVGIISLINVYPTLREKRFYGENSFGILHPILNSIEA